jgi:iron complex transport system substrate-binding protein
VNRTVSISVRRAIAFGLSCAVLLTCELRAQGGATDATVRPATREIVDETGRTVHVPMSVARIVSLAPSLTETVYALGLQDRLVGDTDYCDYPPDAQKKTKVGGIINPNLEEIAALRPDVVLVTKNINRLDTVRALDTLGIPTYASGEPQTVADIVASTKKLADLLGAPDAGKNLADDMERRLSALNAKLQAATPRRVLFVVWAEPLISAGKNTFIVDALRHAGAVSIVDSTKDWPQTNLEQVVRLQPDYLVFASGHSEDAVRDFEALANRPGWRILDAVHNRRFAVISDAVNRPAPRIVSAIEDLARQLHPDAFAEPPAAGKDAAPKPPPSSEPRPLHQSGAYPPLASHPALESACAR